MEREAVISIKCPNCGNHIKDSKITRCPRCYAALLKPGCQGSCSKCAIKGKECS